jgi:hypothetical protein
MGRTGIGFGNLSSLLFRIPDLTRKHYLAPHEPTSSKSLPGCCKLIAFSEHGEGSSQIVKDNQCHFILCAYVQEGRHFR